MKHCFVLNPAAGAGRAEKTLLPRILDTAKTAGVDFEIHRTGNAGDATAYARKLCLERPETRKRFYACGGDGTLNETLNGLYGFGNAELASIPVGSGNDFVRNFGAKEAFLDIEAQLRGRPVPIDALRYELTGAWRAGSLPAAGGGHGDAGGARAHGAVEMEIDRNPGFEPRGGGTPSSPDGAAQSGYAVNMLNMGFDANVVRRMAGLKKTLFLKGTAAYAAGVALELIRFRNSRASVSIDGGAAFETGILLSGVAGGRFSGGGFDGVPMARVDDGLLDVTLITPLPRRHFLALVGKYHDGKHIGAPLLEGKFFHWRCAEASYAPKGDMTLSIDGETWIVRGRLRVSVAEKKLLFSLPAGL